MTEPGREPRQLLDLSDAAIRQAVEMSQRFGRDTEYSRGGGGNSSVKADGVVYIKPSGVPLATLEADDLVPLEMAPLLDLLHGRAGADAEARLEGQPDPVMRIATRARLADAKGRRPSVELLFHSMLPERFVLHTHPIVPNSVTCNREGESIAARIFGDEALWVPYTDPGLPLARAIRDLRAAFEARTGRPAPRVTLMGNHGIIVTGDTIDDVAERCQFVMATVRSELSRTGIRVDGTGRAPRRVADDPAAAAGLVAAIAPSLRGLLSGEGPLKVVTYDPAARVADYFESEAGRAAVKGGPLSPDQIVYAGSFPLLFEPPADAPAEAIPALLREDLARNVADHGTAPILTVVPGLGVFAAGDTHKEADLARLIYLDAMRVSQGADTIGHVRALSDEERGFIETWEVEAYRRNAAAFSRDRGRFGGRIALVTGAAQGFGLEIARGLVAAGGHVILADVNAPLASERAQELEAAHGTGRAWSVAMDVSDETSVTSGVRATVERYGGLDLLVSNAGVLRAGSVTGQPLADFDLVTQVNYRGYFLAVRAVAPVMARQHTARPDYRADVIEINSKSGLEGSKRNFAYAGSKFGGIGLTQSFALELVEDGIKVNAICPGNYLDGPLWSDPQNGLFVQYLREGKVPGAHTIEDVRHAYEAKVPMGRGCTPADVLEAIFYLVAQQYETGQALPVTGGQVMLS
jgi:rhamnose utilization protein RhaD (predicted bifunctional aldolase and dehydrogenase)/NAD(P)-dependent dehydrogenase (short-subunit alcohol dehydrogenase family)